jgi:hypothetical protein
MPILANISQLGKGFEIKTFTPSGFLIRRNIYYRKLDLNESNPPFFALIDPLNRSYVLPPTDFTQTTINGATAPLIYADFILLLTDIIHK